MANGKGENKKVRILARNQTVYSDKNRQIVPGFEVEFEYLPSGEIFRVNVPNLKPDTVYQAVMDLVGDLEGLDTLEF